MLRGLNEFIRIVLLMFNLLSELIEISFLLIGKNGDNVILYQYICFYRLCTIPITA